MQNIRVGCAVVAATEGRLVLGRRGKEPFFGKWIIPGGGVELFEKYSETAAREFREETGLEISVVGVLDVAEIIVPQSEHRIVIYVAADVIGGELRAGSDLLEVRTLDRNEICQLAAADELTPTVRATLEKFKWLGSSNEQVLYPRLPEISNRRINRRHNRGDIARLKVPGAAARSNSRKKGRPRKNELLAEAQLQFSGLDQYALDLCPRSF